MSEAKIGLLDSAKLELQRFNKLSYSNSLLLIDRIEQLEAQLAEARELIQDQRIEALCEVIRKQHEALEGLANATDEESAWRSWSDEKLNAFDKARAALAKAAELAEARKYAASDAGLPGIKTIGKATLQAKAVHKLTPPDLSDDSDAEDA